MDAVRPTYATLAAENERLRAHADRLAACVEPLLAFTKRTTAKLELHDPNNLIGECESALAAHKETV